MADVTIYHNPRCSTSRAAMEVASEAGVEVDTVHYLKEPLDESGLRTLLGQLEDPATDLVRRDAYFKELGLTDSDVADEDQIIKVLVEHPKLMQRPVRPKDRVPAFLAS